MAEITLEYIGKGLDRLTDEIMTMRDDMRVMAAILRRLDDTLQNLVNEMRAWRLNQN